MNRGNAPSAKVKSLAMIGCEMEVLGAGGRGVGAGGWGSIF